MDEVQARVGVPCGRDGCMRAVNGGPGASESGDLWIEPVRKALKAGSQVGTQEVSHLDRAPSESGLRDLPLPFPLPLV